jgi:hypothetical protein
MVYASVFASVAGPIENATRALNAPGRLLEGTPG